MKPLHPLLVLASSLLLLGMRGEARAWAEESTAQPAGRVCPDPARPCPGFGEHDLSFVLPRGEAARDEVRSEPFFAVILRSGTRCSIAERERRAAQALFPRNKVLSQRFECDDDVENNVTYTNVSPGAAFIAVYAGGTRERASAFLATVRATGRFPGANLRRMQVVYVYP